MVHSIWHPRTTNWRLRRLCEGKPVVITGAGSGMGRALALRLACCGVPLLLSDIDSPGLETTAALCRDRGASTVTAVLDVACGDEVVGYADDVVARHGPPAVVVNDAGITMVAGMALNVACPVPGRPRPLSRSWPACSPTGIASWSGSMPVRSTLRPGRLPALSCVRPVCSSVPCSAGS
ncbi:SDR family NAD(P)-dependent oxidoreductase [Gordonia sp. SID5947]|uniref:SDR family NAD(P)-dependent oxidoreductase n=1 Tax=Gordonia sp. SID5947 TaxID=2690315 RepID=UPI001F2A28F1|nr:SDR family NAD(P)-dependent oxidoreductase [Gordonia sp. SID5947]